MKYRVTDKQVDDDGTVCYTIGDGDSNKVGTVFNDGIRTWKCVGKDGLLVNDMNIRRRMYAAVRAFDAATTFPGTVSHQRRI